MVAPAGGLGIYVTVRKWRDFNPRTLEKAMKSAWCPLGSMEMTIVEENFFLFRFDHKQDVSRILREGPWRFNDHPLGIAEAKTRVRITKELLNWVPYWIQVYNIPPMYQSQGTTEHVVSLITISLWMLRSADNRGWWHHMCELGSQSTQRSVSREVHRSGSVSMRFHLPLNLRD